MPSFLSNRKFLVGLAIIGILAILAILFVPPLLKIANRSSETLWVESRYPEYSVVIEDRGKLENILNEFGVQNTTRTQNPLADIKRVGIILSDDPTGKLKPYLGADGQPMSASRSSIKDDLFVIEIYISSISLSEFEENASGLFNYQLASELISIADLDLDKLAQEGATGLTPEDQQLNYLAEKYFGDTQEDKENLYPLKITKE